MTDFIENLSFTKICVLIIKLNSMKGNLKKILFLFICFGTTLLYAQETLRGTVVDASNVPLIGVALIEQGTSNGTVTDFDGNFEMKVSDGNSKIIISYLGFETKT